MGYRVVTEFGTFDVEPSQILSDPDGMPVVNLGGGVYSRLDPALGRSLTLVGGNQEPAPAEPAKQDNSLEGVLSRYNQSNFNVSATAALMRSLASSVGLTEAQIVAQIPATFEKVFHTRGTANDANGFTEGSNYNAIARAAITDSLSSAGRQADANAFYAGADNLVQQGANEAQQRWQATQEPDGGLFGDLGPIAQLAALIPGPQQPFLLAANAANSLSQGNLIGAGLNAFGAYNGGIGNSFDTLGNFFSSGSDAVNSFDTGAMQSILNGGGGASIPLWQQPMAGGVSDTGYGAGRVPSGEANMDLDLLDGAFTDYWNTPNLPNVDDYSNGYGNLPNAPENFGDFSPTGYDDKNLSALAKAAKFLGLTNADGSPNIGKLLGLGGGALLGSLNGAKPAGTTTTVQDIPEWLKPYALNILSKGQGQMDSALASNVGAFDQSDSILKGIMGGSSIQAPKFNPYGGMTASPTSNPYIGQTVTPGTNAHLGVGNPYFESVLNKSLTDTQGRINNQFGNRNAFGGSANQELLQRGLADQSNAARFGEYDKQTSLYEADIARRLQAQQADLLRNSQLAQNQGQFNAQLYQNDATRNAGIWNNDANRNQNAYQFGMGQAFNAATNMPQYQANKSTAGFAPLTSQRGLFTSGSQTTQPYFTNPAGGALYGGLLGSQLFGGK